MCLVIDVDNVFSELVSYGQEVLTNKKQKEQFHCFIAVKMLEGGAFSLNVMHL